MKRLAQLITYAIFPVGGIIGAIGVVVFAPDFSPQAMILTALLVALAISAIWIVPTLIVMFLDDSKRLRTAKKAFQVGDMQTVYDSLQPMTKWTTCSQFELGNEILGLLTTMYTECGQETSVAEVHQLHNDYFELYESSSDGQGRVHDPKISANLKQIFERCRKLASELPPPAKGS